VPRGADRPPFRYATAQKIGSNPIQSNPIRINSTEPDRTNPWVNPIPVHLCVAYSFRAANLPHLLSYSTYIYVFLNFIYSLEVTARCTSMPSWLLLDISINEYGRHAVQQNVFGYIFVIFDCSLEVTEFFQIIKISLTIFNFVFKF